MIAQELEADIIRRVFDESFLNEKLMLKLLRAYGDERARQERERCALVADDLVTPNDRTGDMERDAYQFGYIEAALVIRENIRALD